METKNPNLEEQHYPNPHDHPQNASGAAGKEISQNGTHYDQSEENETLAQFKSELAEQKAHAANEHSSSTENTEKVPVDRPIKDENGELK